ncbi:MAG: flagellar biosynthetic protein FliQ, partial [Proteobacteria bacterium]|nr:flagellar biosynthetic protein FliQ [Pseudomonadota bacterium]
NSPGGSPFFAERGRCSPVRAPIQEMTLTFVPKILVIFVALIIFLPFMMTTLVEFSQELFGLMATLG